MFKTVTVIFSGNSNQSNRKKCVFFSKNFCTKTLDFYKMRRRLFFCRNHFNHLWPKNHVKFSGKLFFSSRIFFSVNFTYKRQWHIDFFLYGKAIEVLFLFQKWINYETKYFLNEQNQFVRQTQQIKREKTDKIFNQMRINSERLLEIEFKY